MNKGKGISENKFVMFSNTTLTEIPVPTKKPQEICTKNAHNKIANYDLNLGVHEGLVKLRVVFGRTKSGFL